MRWSDLLESPEWEKFIHSPEYQELVRASETQILNSATTDAHTLGILRGRYAILKILPEIVKSWSEKEKQSQSEAERAIVAGAGPRRWFPKIR